MDVSDIESLVTSRLEGWITGFSHGSELWDNAWGGAPLGRRIWCWQWIFIQNPFAQSVKNESVAVRVMRQIMSLRQHPGAHLGWESSWIFGHAAISWVRPMGLSRIQSCTEIYTRRGQYELSKNRANIWTRNCDIKGAVLWGQRPHQFYRHRTFEDWSMGLRRGQECKENAAKALQKTITWKRSSWLW